MNVDLSITIVERDKLPGNKWDRYVIEYCCRANIYKQTSPWHRSRVTARSARSAALRGQHFHARFPRLLIDVTNDRLSHAPQKNA